MRYLLAVLLLTATAVAADPSTLMHAGNGRFVAAPQLRALAADPSILMQADRDFAKATEAKGLDGWMDYMAANAVLLRDSPQVGPKNIRASLEKSFSAPGFHLSWEPTKAEFVGAHDDLGYTVGRYEVTTLAGGRAAVEHGSYLTTWQKQKDGSWKVVADIGSPDTLPKPKPQPRSQLPKPQQRH